MLKLLLQQQKIKRKKIPNPAENPLDNPPQPAGRLLLTRGFDILFRSRWKFDTSVIIESIIYRCIFINSMTVAVILYTTGRIYFLFVFANPILK